MILLLTLLWGCALQLPPSPAIPDLGVATPVPERTATSLRVLHVAQVVANSHQQVVGGLHERRAGPISAYLVEHPTEGLVLIDAGLPRRTSVDVGDYPGALTARVIHLKMGVPAANRFDEIGYHPEDVQHIVLTHLHHDHAGGVEDFPDAQLWVDGDEWVAGAKRSARHGYNPEAYAGREPNLISFEGTPPYATFPHHVDLFGDGSVVLLPTPGHTAGSMAVLVQLPTHHILITGDAAWVDANWQLPAPKGALPRRLVEDDWRLGMDAQWRIRAWAERDPELLVIAGHEPANLTRLLPWPQAYR